MNTSLRLLSAATVLVALSACGNKGPLVHPSAAPDQATVPAQPASSDPTATPPVPDTSTPADADPGGAVPPTPAPASPPADDGGSHG